MAEKVGILIEAKDNASSTIKNVKGNLNDLGKGAGEISSLSGAFQGLGKAAGLAGLAIGAIQAGKAIVELAQLGAQAERIETSFRTLTQQAGISSDELVASLQKASSGTISNTELMLTANRALALGVADSTQELEQLMEVAIARGKALGLSAQQAFNDLVTGIGRISPLILDNLGIITGGEKVFDDYASSIGKVGSQLSDTERKQALVNKVIAESKDLVRENAAAGNDAASSFERVAASFQNLKTDLGELFGPAIAAFASSLADAVDATANAVSGTKATIDLSAAESEVTSYAIAVQASEAQLAEYEARLAQLTAGSQEYANAQQATRDIEAQVFANRSNLITAQQTYFDVLRATYPAQEQNAAALNRTSVEAEAAARAMQSGSSAMQQQQSAAANLNGSLAVLAGTYNQVAQAQARIAGSLTPLAGQVAVAAGAEAGLQFLEQSTIELSKQEQKWQQLGYSASEVEVLTYQYKEQLRKTAEETYVFGQAATKANQLAAQSVKALNAEYENLKSTASGILTASLNDIGGVNLDDILPREDAVNEDARRLADIAVRGFDSPWAAYFKEKFPEIFDQLASSGDPKTAAAQILRDFQAGLRPELLDKSRAKELVKRAIIGDQNIKALSDEIAKEVAQELGVSLQEAQSAAAKALGGTTTEQNTQKISVVPTIDRTQLGDQKLEFNATVNSIILGENVLKEIVLLGRVNTIELTEAVALPILAAEMAISKIVIPEEVKPPTPVIVGGMTIDAVALRSDVAIPDVEIAGTVLLAPPDTTSITENVLTLSAVVASMTLGDDIALPIVSAEMAISAIVLSEGVTPPTPSIVGGLTIDAILLPSTVEIPQVTTQANTTIVLLNQAEIESQPLQVTAEIALPDALELFAIVNLQAPDTAAITERPLQLSAFVSLVQLLDTVEIPTIESGMVLNSVTISDDTELPAPAIVGVMTISSVSLSENVVLPIVNLSAIATVQPIDLTAIEQTPINLQANVTLPDLSAPLLVNIPAPDLTGFTEAKPVLNATVDVDWLSASIDNAPEEVVQRLALNVPAYIDFSTIDTETPKAALLERLTLPIVPIVNVEELNTEEQLFAITQGLTPSIVPIINAQGLPVEELAFAGTYIAEGIMSGIVAFNLGNAIVSELVKAQAALRSNGVVSGQVWGSGFNSGAGEYITGIVQTVVNLALAQITRNSTRTGAQ